MPLSTSIYYARPVAHLYRKVLKAVPRTIVMYDMDMSEKQVKARVSSLFRKFGNKPLNHSVLDRLLFLGEQDLKETVEQWKQKPHLYRLLEHNTNDTTKL